MKMIYALIFIVILGYVYFKNQKKALQESDLTGRIITRNLTVTHRDPIDERQVIEFISINENNSATIRTLRSNETLTAKPSEYFIGKDFGGLSHVLSVN
jgi:hypothetical protein